MVVVVSATAVVALCIVVFFVASNNKIPQPPYIIGRLYIYLRKQIIAVVLRGAIVDRPYGTHKNLDV